MRVITQLSTGGPEVLELGEAEIPQPLPTEIRVRVGAKEHLFGRPLAARINVAALGRG